MKNKGITLISLIITIVVSLILVGISMVIAVKSGLFDYAGDAAKKTNTAMAKETEYTDLDNDMSIDALIEKYTTEQVFYGYNRDDNTFIGMPDERRMQTNTTFTQGHFIRVQDYTDYWILYGTPDSEVYLCWDSPERTDITNEEDVFANIETWDVYNPSGDFIGYDRRTGHPTNPGL